MGTSAKESGDGGRQLRASERAREKKSFLPAAFLPFSTRRERERDHESEEESLWRRRLAATRGPRPLCLPRAASVLWPYFCGERSFHSRRRGLRLALLGQHRDACALS